MKANLQKIHILSDVEKRYEILDYLQSMEVIHVNDISEKFDQTVMEFFAREYDDLKVRLSRIEFALSVLSRFDCTKKSMFSIPSAYQEREVDKNLEDFPFNEIYEKLEKESESLDLLMKKKDKMKKEYLMILPWKDLDIFMSDFQKRKKRVSFFAMKMKLSKLDNFKKSLLAKHQNVFFKIIDRKENECFIVVSALQNQNVKNSLEILLKENEGAFVSFPEIEKIPKEHLSELSLEKKSIARKIAEKETHLKKLVKYRHTIELLYEKTIWEQNQKETRKKFFRTKNVVVIEGWIERSRKDALEKGLQKISKSTVILDAEMKKSEVPPVLLKNRKIFGPGETITKMFGLPRSQEIDPSGFLLPFFVTFFGLCLTDAGYGFVLLGVIYFLIKKMKIPISEQGFHRILIMGSVMTIIMGILFGGWFGIDPNIAPDFVTYGKKINGVDEKLFLGQIINPIKTPLILLGISFALGYIQVLFGLFLKAFSAIKYSEKKSYGKYFDGFDGFLPAFYLLSIGGFVLTSVISNDLLNDGINSFFKFLVIFFTLVMIATQGRSEKGIVKKFLMGILSLYALIGYASDILSYSRLLALGLATGIIAMSVNMIASLIGDMIPYVGVVFSIIILIVGHLFNLALNGLGAYIHSLRLQFIEFFSKFYEGGGKEFAPFRKETKYIRLK